MSINSNHSVGKTIATLRKEKGWTQVELSEKLNISDKAISKWEKDESLPGIDLFPVLSKLFNVSIDYLMTGNDFEKIVFMSRSEYCAKNDDPELLRSIKDISFMDENGKRLIDYVIKYESINVFGALFDGYRFDRIWGEYGHNHQEPNKRLIDDLLLIKYGLKSNRISQFKKKKIGKDIKSLKHVDDKQTTHLLMRDRLKIEHNNRLCVITDDILDVIVKYPGINKDTIDYLVSNIENRQYVWYEMFPYLIHKSYMYENYLLLEALLVASMRSNEYAYENFAFVYDDIGISNYETEKFGVYKHHIYGDFPRPLLHGLVRIFEATVKLALERGDTEFVKLFNRINGDLNKYDKRIKSYVVCEDEDFNVGKNERDIDCDNKTKRLECLENCKTALLEIDKKRGAAIENKDVLGEAYFNKEIESGSLELVVVKLCVKLEILLRDKYHLEGDFSEMLTSFCEARPEKAALLHKLRRSRNNIVHPDKTDEKMSKEELKRCADYIFKQM